jgi:predicted TIM-barrel fold metal-dependent hydrolase
MRNTEAAAHCTRRQIIGAALGIAAAPAPAEPAGIPIIDTHQHLWDLKQFRPPWLRGPGEEKINHPFTMREYRLATAGLNVVKTVYMEVDVDPRQQVEEAEFVLKTCRSRSTPMVAGVISARPAEPGFRSYILRYKDRKEIKGVRQVLQVPGAPRGLCLTAPFVKSIRLCGELGKTFDLCMRPEEILDGAKLADLCPHTQFVLDHCGNASARNPKFGQWERDIAAVAKRRNIVCKVSGIVKTVQPGWDAGEELEPIVRHVLNCFGPDRVMFGGDWPVCNKTSSFKAWVQALEYILRDASDSEKRRLFHDNAARFYQI